MFKFESLEIWKLAIGYSIKIVNLVEDVPDAIRSTIGTRLIDAALALSLRIAEGSEGASKKDFLNRLDEAMNETYAIIALLHILKEKIALKDERFREYYNELVVLSKKMQVVRNTL